MTTDDDCPPCVFFGAVGVIESLCGVLAKRGEPMKCNILGEQAFNEEIPVKQFAEKVREAANRRGFRRMVKEIDSITDEIEPHIKRQARGEKLPTE